MNNKSKKKVLVINTARTGLTGMTSVIMNYTQITHSKIDYDFVLVGKVDPITKEELKKITQNIFLPHVSRTKRPFKYTRWLKRLMAEKKYDAVHVHANSATAYFDIHAAKLAGVPIRICHSHSSFCKYKLVHKILRPLLNREVTSAVACSDFAGEWLYSGDFTVLYNGIDVDKYKFSETARNQYRKELNLGNKFVIGHVGYLEPLKNHMYLLAVFKKLLKSVPDATLLLVGEGSMRQTIEEYVRENNMQNNVMLLGNRSDVAGIYQCMDVLALPSLWEGLPVTLVEGQTSGLPCIVSATVTRQADLTGEVSYLEIGEENINDWVNEFESVNINFESRYEKEEVIKNSAFNIHNNANTLLKLYGE